MSASRRRVLLVQLPIPPCGPEPVRGNVPLAAGYLKLFARRAGLETDFDIELLPPRLANTLGDQGVVEAILAGRPWLVGFTCYVWNIERTLWIAHQLKQACPELRIVVGGPEIALDNAWVLEHPAIDYAVLGEGEQTFAELLAALRASGSAQQGSGVFRGIDGLWCRGADRAPRPRRPLENLDLVASPYLEGILDLADEPVMFLETLRGCTFRCKFCYYPKNYGKLYAASFENIAQCLRFAAMRHVREIVLLDPTFSQRADFADLLRLFGKHRSAGQWTCFGELRAEAIDCRTARLLREAGFTEVEIGLQSVDPRTQALVGRPVDLSAFEQGARAMLEEGIRLRVDMILGLPGDTPASVRRGIDYLHRTGLYSKVQWFNLSVLPGTVLRREAGPLGLEYQSRPPYYVLRTPTLELDHLYQLMEEAQQAFGGEYDPIPLPCWPRGAVQQAVSHSETATHAVRVWEVDLDGAEHALPPPGRRAVAFTLHLRSRDFDAQTHRAIALVRRAIEENPHATLDVVLWPRGDPIHLTERTLDALLAACYSRTSYLDFYYSLHPNRLMGAKRLVVILPIGWRNRLGAGWADHVGRFATLVWQTETENEAVPDDLHAWEHCTPPLGSSPA